MRSRLAGPGEVGRESIGAEVGMHHVNAVLLKKDRHPQQRGWSLVSDRPANQPNMRSVHGGVRPWWLQGSSVTTNVLLKAATSLVKAMASAWVFRAGCGLLSDALP